MEREEPAGGEAPRHTPIEEMDFFKEYVAIAEWAWSLVIKWSPFARDTIGKQLVRAIDRVGATLVEGDGRYSDAEAAHFFTIARASARETRFWIQRSVDRHLIPAAEAEARLTSLVGATRQLNGVIRYRRRAASGGRVRERLAPYSASCEDPFIDPVDGNSVSCASLEKEQLDGD